jgi:ribokinase
MATVFITGSFNVDHVWRVPTLPQAGATLSGHYSTGPGGKGFNQAIAARRSGAQTHFVCALGADLGAQLARDLCQSDGLFLSAAESTAPTGTAGIYVDANGLNCIVIGAGANADLQPSFVAHALQGLRANDVVLAQLESPLESIAYALTLGRQCGATTLLNPAPANVTIDRAMLDRADILTPNETEFSALLSRHVGERVEADEVASIDQPCLHALCRDLLPEGSVVVTLGSSGCFVSHTETQLHGDAQAFYRVPAEAANVVDTTGAGDAFNGALASSLAQRPTLAFIEHVRFATGYAARSTETKGAALAMPVLAVG